MIPILRGIFVEDAAHLKAIMRYSRPFRLDTAMPSTKDLGASLRMDLKAYRAHPSLWHGRREAVSMRMLMLPRERNCTKADTVSFWIVPRYGEATCDGPLICLLPSPRGLHISHSSQERNERMTASQRSPLFDRPGTAVSTSSTNPMPLFRPPAPSKGLRSCRI